VSDARKQNSRRHSEVSSAYLEHRTFLKRFLSRFLSNPDDIDDVVQETFLRAYNAENNDTDIHSPKAFLFRVARNLALKELGRKSRRITDYIEDLGATEVIDEQSSVEDQVAERERLAVFCKAAAALPLQCRRAFLLRKIYGLSQQEISRELNISVSTVEKHLATGLMRCNAFMAAHGYQPAKKRATGKGRS
jgi:RNA polymerase sigma-70 factor (ECF subfamily)